MARTTLLHKLATQAEKQTVHKFHTQFQKRDADSHFPLPLPLPPPSWSSSSCQLLVISIFCDLIHSLLFHGSKTTYWKQSYWHLAPKPTFVILRTWLVLKNKWKFCRLSNWPLRHESCDSSFSSTTTSAAEKSCNYCHLMRLPNRSYISLPINDSISHMIAWQYSSNASYDQRWSVQCWQAMNRHTTMPPQLWCVSISHNGNKVQQHA